MRIIFLLPLLLIGTPFVFADDVYRGDTYQDIRSSEIIDGKIKHIWIGGLPPYLESGNLDQYGRKQFIPYKYTDTENSKIVESGGVSYKINKSTCTVQLYNNKITQNSIPVIDDVSYTMQEKVNNTWRNSDHNNYSCLITVTQSPDEIMLITKQGDDIIGYKEIEYRLKNGELEVFLRSPFDNLGGKQYGFAESHIKVQDVFIKDTKYDLNSPNTDLTKEEMRNNQLDVKVITKNQGGTIIFDTKDTIHNTLTDVKIKKYNENKLQSVYDYHNTQILTQGTRLEIDPTFSSSNPTVDGDIIEADNTNVCNDGSATFTKTTTGTKPLVGMPGTAEGGDCGKSFFEYDISSIPSSAAVSSATFKYEVDSLEGVGPNACDFIGMGFQPSVASDLNIYDSITTGTVLANADSTCGSSGTNKSVSLTTSYFQTRISNTTSWASIGIKADVESPMDATYRQSYIASEENATPVPSPTLEITYLTSLDTVITNLSCTGQPYYYSCSWTSTNATSNTGYYVQHSPNNSTWSLSNQTLIANVTSYNYTGFGISESNYIRVNGTASGTINSTSSNVVYTTTDNYPDTPSITATGATKTQIDIIRTAGSYDGGDTVSHYDLRCELNNAGGWLGTQINATIVNFYNYTGLTGGDDLTCQWRDRNGVGYSQWSVNGTARTVMTTNGTLSFVSSNIGDMFLFNGTLADITASPTPATATLVSVVDNDIIVSSKAISNSLPDGGTASITFIPQLIQDDNTHSIKLRITATNNTNTVTIDSAVQNFTREYDPDYFLALDPDMGYVNYTISRTTDQTKINLKANRDQSGGNFNIECLYRSMTDAALNTGGTWHNYTSVYFMNDTLDDALGTHYYIDCYNDGLLFQVVSYTNSSMLLAGIQVFDDTYGTFIGVPVGVFFIVLVAGMANQRTAPMWIVVILAIAGIMSAIGFFTLETNVWALALIAALLGIIVGRKLF